MLQRKSSGYNCGGGAGLHRWRIGAAPLHLSPGERWPQQQQPSEMTTRCCDDSLSRSALRSFPLFIRMLFTTPACSSLVKLTVNLITLTICKVVV